jgi:glycosyltransferase involved in cell wall biosynthesis
VVSFWVRKDAFYFDLNNKFNLTNDINFQFLGPTETVLHGKTGVLCEDTPTEFATNMLKLVGDGNLIRQLGLNGRKRVIDEFSFDAFKRRLNSDLL